MFDNIYKQIISQHFKKLYKNVGNTLATITQFSSISLIICPSSSNIIKVCQK